MSRFRRADSGRRLAGRTLASGTSELATSDRRRTGHRRHDLRSPGRHSSRLGGKDRGGARSARRGVGRLGFFSREGLSGGSGQPGGQGLTHLPGAAKAILQVESAGPIDQSRQGGIDQRGESRQRGDAQWHRELAGKHLAHGGTQSVEIRARLGTTLDLLEGRIAQSVGPGGSASSIQRMRQPQIHQHDLATAGLAQNIGRLDVAMENRGGERMQVFEDLQHREDGRNQLACRNGTTGLLETVGQLLFEAGPLDKIRDDVAQTVDQRKITHTRKAGVTDAR